MTYITNKEWGHTEIVTTDSILAEVLDTLKEILSELRNKDKGGDKIE